jgi:hypothetical protein
MGKALNGVLDYAQALPAQKKKAIRGKLMACWLVTVTIVLSS